MKTYFKNKLIFMLAIMLMAVAGRAQDLNTYLEAAAENNPGLRASYLVYEAAMQKIDQVSSLPDPVLSFGYYIQPVETRVGPQQARFSLKQMFPWFGTLASKNETAALLAESKFQDFIHERDRLFLRVKQAYYRIYETDRILDATKENLEIAQSYLNITETKFENARAPVVDVIRVQMTISDLETEIAVLMDERKAEAIAFNKLLNRSENDTVVITPPGLPGDPDIETYRDSLLANNPQLAAIDFRIRSQESRQQTARKNAYPDLGVGIDYIITGKRNDVSISDNGKDAIVPGASVSIPIFQKKYAAARKEAELLQESLEWKRQDKTNMLISDFEEARYQLESARQKIILFRQQLDQTGRALNLLLTTYSQNSENFEEVLRMQQQVLRYETAMATATKNYFTALARIEYLSGNSGEMRPLKSNE